MSKRNKKIKVFYNPKQVLEKDSNNYSKSPLKPKLLLDYLKENNLGKYLKIEDNFNPFEKKDFEIAHNETYVNNFFKGIGNCESNGLKWSKQFADSIRYTNSSLYNSILNSIKNPKEVSFSPTSGFHHARPNRGDGFCTFSGQVIASKKIYDDLGLTGAYLDLDGHYGNSIEDSRKFVKNLDKAVPKDCNINPKGKGQEYIDSLENSLDYLEKKILNKEVNYLVWCHGADSHKWDDLGYQCSTEQWTECSRKFYNWVSKIDEKLEKPIPLTLSLFGGYRKDDFDSVLSLHTSDIVNCLNTINKNNIKYKTKVNPKGVKIDYTVSRTIEEKNNGILNTIKNYFI